MRMSMNRTLPDLPFACPGKSGYEIIIWGFPVTKIMPMVKLCVEWLRKLLAYLNSQVNILSIFGLSKFLFCL